MDRLALCCLLFTGLLNPLLSLPVTDSGEATLQLPALNEDARLAREELEKVSLLQTLKQATGTEAAEALRGTDSRTDGPNPRGNLRKAFSRQDSNIVLSHLLTRARKQRKQDGVVPECFWKYCT